MKDYVGGSVDESTVPAPEQCFRQLSQQANWELVINELIKYQAALLLTKNPHCCCLINGCLLNVPF